MSSGRSLFVGPAITLATVATIYLVHRQLFPVPNPAVIYLCAVVFAAYYGGMTSGLISAAISLAFAAFFFSDPGQLFQYRANNLSRLTILFITTPIIAVLAGLLKRQATRALDHERSLREQVEAKNLELAGLRAAIDQSNQGVVLLGKELRAEFINRAFRDMFRLPDEKADKKPAFVGLMYHGRDTRAYEIADQDLDAYIARRVAEVQAGNETARDIRLANGEVLRFQCKVLPEGRRLLTYTYVTDIVRHADELETLRAALDQVEYGIILLDRDLRMQFINRVQRRVSQIPDEFADRKPHFPELFDRDRNKGVWDVPQAQFEAYRADRMAVVQRGDPTPHDLHLRDGRILRSQCAVLPDGGRMLSYMDVTEIVRHADELQHLATIDGMTSIPNRRHFMTLAEAEWNRFRRYERPLCLLMIDIDHFKSINDRFGHGVGDRAIMHVARLCGEGNRTSDVIARIGGEEFAVLLPETDLDQACIVAERIRQKANETPLIASELSVLMTVSIGVSDAHLNMGSFDELMKRADDALYEAKRGGRNRVVRAPPYSAGRDEAAA